jgi:DNA oxidative demethylase
MTKRHSLPDGFRVLPETFDRNAQEALVAEIRDVLKSAPLFQPVMPKTGKAFSVRMSNCGPLGWVSDKSGYRYQSSHPVTGAPWPHMPDRLTALWRELAPDAPEPEACLINFYEPGAKMGLHQDRDEQTFDAPVISVSLGDTATFRIGGQTRKSPTSSLRLSSGDVVVLGGNARLAYHGIDRVLPGTSTLLKNGGRINLTLRRVSPPNGLRQA